MEKFLHHLGCTKPCKSWDKLPTSTGFLARFQPSTVACQHWIFPPYYLSAILSGKDQDLDNLVPAKARLSYWACILVLGFVTSRLIVGQQRYRKGHSEWGPQTRHILGESNDGHCMINLFENSSHVCPRAQVLTEWQEGLAFCAWLVLHVVAQCITSSAKPLHKRFRKGNTFKKPQMMHVAAAATDDEIILIFLAFAPRFLRCHLLI